MGGGNVVVLGDAKSWDGIVGSGKTVIVDFTATWCGPCRMMAPIFAKLSEQEDCKDLVFLEVDVDQFQAIAHLAGISAMPTFQVWKAGQKVEEFMGGAPAKLQALVAKYVGQPVSA